jgi:RNA polymerase sigma-70 factor, ECF subfamily
VPDEIRQALAFAQRALSGKILAATLRTVRDLDIAQESTADAFLLALQSWPGSGVPRSVEAWLITAAKRRAVDRIRHAKVARSALLQMAGGWSGVVPGADGIAEAAVVGDDELRLVVLCCDPRITVADQVCLTLRLACGVSTAAIAAAYGIRTPTIAARLTRAKAKLAAAGPQLDLPDDATVDARLPAVAQVVLLAFTLGHTAGDGPALTDEDLADRAQYLASVLHALRPANPSIAGLLGLILLTRGRAAGRFDAAGEQVLLADADRRRWDHRQIDRGLRLLHPFAADTAAQIADPIVLRALISAEHSRARSYADTNWSRVIDLYDRLLTVDPALTAAVGRAVAIAQMYGAAAGLADLDGLLAVGGLESYPYAFAARARLLGELGRPEEAAAEWRRASATARTDAERAYFDSSCAT